MSQEILYLCPEVPYPSNTGGKVAFSNHLDIIAKKSSGNVSAVFLDVDGDRYGTDLKEIYSINNAIIFKRKIAHGSKLLGYLSALFYTFFYITPRAYFVRKNSDLIKHVDVLLQKNNYEKIFFDHFSAFAFLKSIPTKKNKKYVYIALNVESKVLYDQSKESKNYLKKIYYYTEYLKTWHVEKKIIKCVDSVIAISSADTKYLSNLFPDLKIKNIPEIVQLKTQLWHYNQGKRIVFVGGTNYFPNYDAVNWIVKDLMPLLIQKDPEITCSIIGNCKNYIDDNSDLISAVKFTGLVSDAELENLFITSNLFLSPIILGSGIKIKMLTALSYTIPALCTQESAKGIDYIDLNKFIFTRDNLTATVEKITGILNDRVLQEEMSLYIQNSVKTGYQSILEKWEI